MALQDLVVGICKWSGFVDVRRCKGIFWRYDIQSYNNTRLEPADLES